MSARPGASPHAASPVVRRGDQGQDPEPGQLVCRLSQHGESGRWSGTDSNNNPLVVTQAGDGTWEVRHVLKGNGEEDPDQVRLETSLGRDAGAGKARPLSSGWRGRSPRGRDVDQRNPACLRGLSAL
jgi:hypothetical protein